MTERQPTDGWINWKSSDDEYMAGFDTGQSFAASPSDDDRVMARRLRDDFDAMASQTESGLYDPEALADCMSGRALTLKEREAFWGRIWGGVVADLLGVKCLPSTIWSIGFVDGVLAWPAGFESIRETGAMLPISSSAIPNGVLPAGGRP